MLKLFSFTDLLSTVSNYTKKYLVTKLVLVIA